MWIPSATPGSASRDDRHRDADLRRQRAAVGVAQHDPLGPRVGRRARAVQRVAGVFGEAVEEVLGVEQHALAVSDQERDRLGDHLQVLLARDAHDLLDVQHRGLADERAHGRERLREDPQPLVRVGVDPAPARHPERDDLSRLEALLGEQLEQLLLLRVRRREAGLDHVHAERVERVHDAQLLIGGQAHAAAAHAVAQGGVVELDVGSSGLPRDGRRGRRARGGRAAGHIAGGSLQRRRGNHVEPLAVALGAPVDRVVEGGLEHARDLARLAGADRVVVDLAHRHELGGGAGQEDLVGEVQLGAGDVALDDLVAEVAGRSGSASDA